MFNNFVTVNNSVHFAIGLKDSLTGQKVWYVFECPAPRYEDDPKMFEKRTAAYKKLAFKCYKSFDGFAAYVETANGLELIKEVI